MGVAVDLLADQLLGAGDRERGHLATQVFLGAGAGGVDLGEAQRLLAVGFGDRVVLGGLDDLVGTLVRLVEGMLGASSLS